MSLLNKARNKCRQHGFLGALAVGAGHVAGTIRTLPNKVGEGYRNAAYPAEENPTPVATQSDDRPTEETSEASEPAVAT